MNYPGSGNFFRTLVQDLRNTDTREQFKRRLKGWLFECASGRRRVWQTLTEGEPYKWTSYLLTRTANRTGIGVASIQLVTFMLIATCEKWSK